MHLGTRRIRSAGRNSGSIEVTLPTALQVLEGVECRLMVRNGSRPEIVLQPDLAAARALFCELWQKLCVGLEEIGEIGDFSPADFTLTLFPAQHWHHRPPLAYADALALLHQPPKADHWESEPLARLLTFMAVAAVHRLGLTESLALAFGDAVAYLVTGTSAGLGNDFERGMAHRAFWEGARAQFLGSPFDDQVWQRVGPGLRRVYERFRAWQDDPEVYQIVRQKWHRALTVEIGMLWPLAEGYPESS